MNFELVQPILIRTDFILIKGHNLASLRNTCDDSRFQRKRAGNRHPSYLGRIASLLAWTLLTDSKGAFCFTHMHAFIYNICYAYCR